MNILQRWAGLAGFSASCNVQPSSLGELALEFLVGSRANKAEKFTQRQVRSYTLIFHLSVSPSTNIFKYLHIDRSCYFLTYPSFFNITQ